MNFRTTFESVFHETLNVESSERRTNDNSRVSLQTENPKSRSESATTAEDRARSRPPWTKTALTTVGRPVRLPQVVDFVDVRDRC